MPSEPTTPPPGPDHALSDQALVNLQILSPSVGVNRPLLFPDLPAATTIKQLKAKIRESLPRRPADQHQRLIHLGRALMRDDDCLSDVLGADAVRSHPDQQTIHLVLRDDGASSQKPVPPSTTSPPSPASQTQQSAAPTNSVSAQTQPRPVPAAVVPLMAQGEWVERWRLSLADDSTRMSRSTGNIANNGGQGLDRNPLQRSFSSPTEQTRPLSQSESSAPRTEVYLLSTPDGPFAILCDGAASEMYTTPRRRANPQTAYSPYQLNNLYNLYNANPDSFMLQIAWMDQRLAINIANTRSQQLLMQQQQQALQQQALQLQQLQSQPQPRPQPRQPRQRQPRARPQHRAGLVHPNNLVAAGVPALMVQLIPHLWLMARLAFFVWLFTSPTASWSRWLTIISLAVFLFALSTGILNGIAEHVWRPVGRHLENVFPVAEYARPQHGQAGGGAQGQGQGTAAAATAGGGQDLDPDPSRMAARLVAEHRQRESWLLGYARRVERALLLFVASIAPGVAERHIAHLEAEARRREAEAAAAATAAAAAAAAATAAAATDTTTTGTGTASVPNQAQSSGVEVPESGSGSGNGDMRQRQEGARRHDRPGEDLVAL